MNRQEAPKILLLSDWIQVKEINQLVLRLDSDKQRLYKEFMQENDERDQKHRDLIHKNVGEMSPKAQEQFVKVIINQASKR